MGDNTQTQATARIKLKAVESLARMGRLCQQLGEQMSGQPGKLFLDIAEALGKYQEGERRGEALELSMSDTVAFWWISLAKDTRDQKPMPAVVRVTRPEIEALLAFAQLFEGDEAMLPWNGPGIREAARSLSSDLIGDPKAERSLICYLTLLNKLRGLGEAFHIAVEEMRRQIPK